MTPEEIHLLRKQIALVGFSSVAFIELSLAIVVSAFAGPGYHATLLMAVAGATLAIPYAQVNDGWIRRAVEAVYGEPDTPHYDDLKKEVELHV